MSTLPAKAFTFEIKGVDPELQKNVTAHLSSIVNGKVRIDDRFKARAEALTQFALRAKGYYEPQITINSPIKKTSSSAVLTIEIKPGRSIRLAKVIVTLDGPADSDADFQQLLHKDLPLVGERLDHGKFDQFIEALSNLAVRKGYFDAQVIQRKLVVSPSHYQAFWHIIFKSGRRYQLGKVTIQGSQIRPYIMQNLIPFKRGEPYTIHALMKLNHCLSATQWFNSVTVTPLFNETGHDNQLPLLATVEARQRNAIETGLGYSSDIGPSIGVKWKKPWINTLGHSLENSLDLSKPKQQLDVKYRIPLSKSPLEHYYLMKASVQRERQNDTVSRTIKFSLARHWDFYSGWQRAINLQWRGDHFTQGSQPQIIQLLYPGISLGRIRQRGTLMPHWGDSQRYTVECSRRLWGSDINFVCFKLENVWIRTPWPSHRWVTRIQAGWIKSDHFLKVPADLRFFAGGERSIRGYRYKSLSPKDKQGKLMGASALFTGSLEYQYNLVQSAWWLALFIDCGEAENRLSTALLKKGAGVGIRWASPLGPIKFDIARPIHDPLHRKIQLYLSLGAEL